MPIPTPEPPVTQEMLSNARQAVCRLRDFAREHGMDFRQRDPLVMAIHNALDAQEVLLLQRAQEIAELQKENAILRLANPIEEDLQLKIDEALKYLAMEQGFTLAGLARLFVECQRRLADDWLAIGGLRRQLTARAQEIEQVKAENAETMRLLTEERDKFSGARQRLSHLEGVRLPHARRQENANGFQRGWHAALSRVSEGDRWEDLAEVVPQPAATVEIPVCEVEALLTARAQEIEQVKAALDEIGAPTEDALGSLTLSGRCWALSNCWHADAALVSRAPQPER